MTTPEPPRGPPPPPPKSKPNGDYAEGYKAGWLAGYDDGKSAGYTDAKVRARLALEAACDHLALPRRQRDALIRTSNNVVGTVE